MQVHLTIIFIVALIVGCGIVGGIGLHDQHDALWNYQSATGRIIEVADEPAALPGGELDLGVAYRFNVRHKHYESTRLTPMAQPNDRAWANQLLGSLNRGDSVRVYYDPANPSDSFIVRRAVFWPYFVLMVPAFALLMVRHPLRRGGFLDRAPAAIKNRDTGWYEVAAQRTPARATGEGMVTTVLWFGFGGLLVSHYIAVGQTTPDALRLAPVAGITLYALAGLWPLARTWRAFGRAGDFDPPRVCTTLDEHPVNKPLLVRVELHPLCDFSAKQIAAALVCHKRHGLMSIELFSQTQVLTENVQLKQFHTDAWETTFEVPSKKHRPSSEFHRWDYPRTEWLIELTITNSRGKHTRIDYPVILTPATRQHEDDQPKLKLAG